MPNAQYHHGTETKSIDSSLVPIYSVESAIVALVGTAPIGPVNELIQCQKINDFAQFGPATTHGYTLPKALHILEKYGAGKFYVVNVLDPKIHRSTVTDEVLEVNPNNFRAQTQNIGLISIEVKDSARTYLEGSDYHADLINGVITVNVKPDGELTADYIFADPSLVTTDDIKGGYDVSTAKRKGMELWREGFFRFGKDASILLAPYFDEEAAVARELENYRIKLNAIAYVQAPKGTTPSEAQTGRGPLGTINFNTSDVGTHLFYDYLNGDEPLAVHAAGLRMLVDVTEGYWYSTSNHNLIGVTTTDFALTARIDDQQSETNLLNSVGITTVFNSYGTGFRLWGGRLASFPNGDTTLKNFEVVKRSQLIIDESIRVAELQFIDKPIDGATIESLLESVDAFGRDLCAPNGPLLGFKCWWSESNSERSLSMGQYYIAYKFTPKVPGERITNESEVTSEYYGVLNSTLREQYGAN